MTEFLIVHFDWKLLSAWDARKSKEELLQVVNSYGNKVQLIGVLRLEISLERKTGKGGLDGYRELIELSQWYFGLREKAKI